MNLFKTELRRLLSRRLLRGSTALVVIALSVAGVLTFINSDDSAAAVAAMEAERTAALEECITNFESDRGAVGETTSGRARSPRAVCEEEVWVEDPRFVYTEVQWILMSIGVPMIMLAWLVGASFIGAEWTNRTLTSTLTWEPRRLRVLGAKLSSVGLVSFVWLVVLQIYLAAVLFPSAYFRGDTSNLDAAFWGDLGGTLLRVAALGVVAAFLGFSLATMGRNTAAALGVGFVQLAVVEGLIRGFRPQWSDWLIGDNVSLFLVGPADIDHLGHSQEAAGLLLAVYALTLVAGAAAIFRRREMS